MNWRTHECDLCPALVASRSKVVLATPCRRGGLLIIGEAPGKKEDLHGMGFVGAAGKTLRNLLRDSGLTCTDYGVANICRCLPLDSERRKVRPPTSDEIGHCLPYLASLIGETRPKVILAVGASTAAEVIFGIKGLAAQLEAGRKVGWQATEIRLGAPEAIRDALKDVTYIVPMPHTSSANRRKEHKKIAGEQVTLAVTLLRRRSP